MKQTALKRKTPLKAKKGLTAKTPLKAKKGLKSNSTLKSNGGLKQVSDKKRKQLEEEGKSIYSTLSSNSTLKQVSDKKKANPSKPKRGNSLKGAGRTESDKQFHSDIVALGCAACNHEGVHPKHPLQVHHPEGRNRGSEGDYKEKFSLCLCAEHHDQRIYHGYHNGFSWVDVDKSIPSVHGAKKSFYDRYGSEALLVHEQYVALNRQPPWLSDDEWKEFLSIEDRASQDEWVREAMNPKNAKKRRLLTKS